MTSMHTGAWGYVGLLLIALSVLTWVFMVIHARNRPHEITGRDAPQTGRGEVSGGVVHGSLSQLSRRDEAPTWEAALAAGSPEGRAAEPAGAAAAEPAGAGDVVEGQARGRPAEADTPATPRETQVLTPEELAVYETVATRREVTAEEIERATGLHHSTVDAAIDRLRRLRMIADGPTRVAIGPNDWDASR